MRAPFSEDDLRDVRVSSRHAATNIDAFATDLRAAGLIISRRRT